MLDKLESILNRYAELEQQLAEVGQDYQLAAELSKERSDLEPIVSLAKEYKEECVVFNGNRMLIKKKKFEKIIDELEQI